MSSFTERVEAMTSAHRTGRFLPFPSGDGLPKLAPGSPWRALMVRCRGLGVDPRSATVGGAWWGFVISVAEARAGVPGWTDAIIGTAIVGIGGLFFWTSDDKGNGV